MTSSCEINSSCPKSRLMAAQIWINLAQVMALCLTAPSHYLGQCWKYLWYQSVLTRMSLEITFLKLPTSVRGVPEWVKRKIDVELTEAYASIKPVISGSDNGLVPNRQQTIASTHVDSIGSRCVIFSGISIKMRTMLSNKYFWKCLRGGCHFALASVC